MLDSKETNGKNFSRTEWCLIGDTVHCAALERRVKKLRRMVEERKAERDQLRVALGDEISSVYALTRKYGNHILIQETGEYVILKEEMEELQTALVKLTSERNWLQNEFYHFAKRMAKRKTPVRE